MTAPRTKKYFAHRVVLVTGSTRGIGRELVGQLLQRGAKVIVHGREKASAEAACHAWDRPEETAFVWGDLSDRDRAVRAVELAVSRWGRIDVLINNAGRSMRGDWSDVTPAAVEALWKANFLTSLWTTQACLPHLQQTKGRVAFVSTLAALRGFPGTGPYSVTKAALSGLQESLEAEWHGQGVRTGIVYLPFVENDPDKTILDAQGTEFRHERSWTWSQTQAARAVLAAVAKGRRRTVTTASGRLLLWAQALAPAVIDTVMKRSRGSIHAVKARRTP